MSRKVHVLNEESLSFEARKLLALQAAERELDSRTEVTWLPATSDERCSNRRIVEASGRVMQCSERATVLKLRIMNRRLPVAFLCEAHARERGYRENPD